MNFDKITQPKIVSTISLLCLIFIIRYHLVGSFDINLNDADGNRNYYSMWNYCTEDFKIF